jgi:hypothetical protein
VVIEYNKTISEMQSILTNGVRIESDKRVQIEIRNEQQKNEKLKQLTQERIEFEADMVTDQIEMTSMAIGAIAGLAREGTEEYKVLKSAEAVIATYSAANQALADTAGGPMLLRIATMITVIATGLANIVKINAVKFRKGTEYLNADGTGTDPDGVLIEAHEGERIMTAEQNRQLSGIKNTEIPGLVKIGRMYNFEAPILSAIAQQQLREQKESNRLLKKFKFVDKDGKIITLEGNVIAYV